MGSEPREVQAAAGEFRLGDWLVQRHRNRLSCGQQMVQLEPKLMEVLVTLAERAGEVVSKEAITDAVWTDQFISESVITRAIAGLRRALGDDAQHPRFIETISKRGYRLMVTPSPATEQQHISAPGSSMPVIQVGASPFVVGQWVRGEWFYGRAVQISEILQGNRNSLWLLGTRCIGKTSLLKQLEHITASSPELGYVPLFWDLQGADSPAELHHDLNEALLEAEERLRPLGIEVAGLLADDLFTTLSRLRRELRARERTLLLLCDETEELIQLNQQDPTLLRKLRRALQSREGIRSVLASSIRLWQLAEEESPDTSPFLHGFTPPLYIEALQDEEARLLIRQTQLNSAAQPAFSDETVEVIRRHCGNHPYLIQLLCRSYLERGELELSIEEVATARTVDFFFAVDYELLSKAERLVLRSSAGHPATSASLQQSLDLEPATLTGALHRLESLGLLRRDTAHRVVPASSFLARWLQRQPS